MLARVLGVVWGLAMGAVALGSAVGAAAVGLLGANATFVLVGLVLPLLALVSYGRLRSIEASVPPAARLDVVEGVPIFAPLSLAAKEQVAAKLSEATFEPAQTVMRQGDDGDVFYIVARRRVDSHDGSGAAATARGRLLRRDRSAARRAAHRDRDRGDAGPPLRLAA